jgi:branched-chain amino acid transport system substrate-binding protein
MDTINIGLLLPTSTIFPIGKEFEKGLKTGLKEAGDANIEIEITKEFVGQGDIKTTENACNKLFNFDDADLVTGIVSNQTAKNLAERFKSRQTSFLISNVGGHVPNVTLFNEYVFVNSMHLWRQAYTLGYAGVKQFGKKGMFIGSVYDAGYSFSHLFHQGMMAADPQAQWSFSVPPMPPAGSLSDMSVIFPFLEQYQPDFIMATFCGAETTLFLNEFIARGWHHKTKVLGLPYLLAPFAPLNDDITIYTTRPFEDSPEVTPANAFYHLGLQAGKNIANAAKLSPDRAGLRDALSSLKCMFNVADTDLVYADKFTLVENTIKATEEAFTSKDMAEWPAFNLSTEQIRTLSEEVAGWYNPYLCI